MLQCYSNPQNEDLYKCLRPRLIGVALPTDVSKRTRVRYNEKKGKLETSKVYGHVKRVPLPVACGCCSNCLRLRSRQWSARMAQEMIFGFKCNPDNYHTYFITLTFNDDSLPTHCVDSNLAEKKSYRLVQNFFKRLRKGNAILAPLKFRYYCVGEFGDSKNHRFHYHALLFVENNNDIPDWLTSINTPDWKKIGVFGWTPQTMPKQTNKFGRTYWELSLHDISSAKRKHGGVPKRLQTHQEATLSFILNHYYWDYGNVSVGSADTVGSCSYLTKYLHKNYCSKDDLKSFARFSKMLGREYFETHLKEIHDGNLKDMDRGETSAFGSVPLPRSIVYKYRYSDPVQDAIRIKQLPDIVKIAQDDYISRGFAWERYNSRPFVELEHNPDFTDILEIEDDIPIDCYDDLPVWSMPHEELYKQFDVVDDCSIAYTDSGEVIFTDLPY